MKSMRIVKNIKNTHKIKACAVGVLLSVSMQNSHASGVPTIDGAVLGNGIQEFISQTAEHAEEAARWIETKLEWAKRLKNWTTEFDVVRQGFDTFQDIQSIAGSIGEITDFAGELQKTVKDIEEKGAAGLASDLLRDMRGESYNAANKEISDSCTLIGEYEKKLIELDKEIAEREKISLKNTEKQTDRLSSTSSAISGSTTAATITAGVSAVQSKAMIEDKKFARYREKLIHGRDRADKLCIASIGQETKNAVQEASFGVNGSGMNNIFSQDTTVEAGAKGDTNNMLDPKPN